MAAAALTWAVVALSCSSPEVELDDMHHPVTRVEPRREPRAAEPVPPEAAPAITGQETEPRVPPRPQPTPSGAIERGLPREAAAGGTAALAAELAKERIDEGDFEGARRILEGLLTAPFVEEAAALIAAGEPEEALTVTERALTSARANDELLLVHGEASLRVGTRLWDQGLVEDALRAFAQVEGSARASLGASRAARWLGRTDEALRHARAGMQGLRAEGPGFDPASLAERPERSYAEAVFAAYLEERTESLFLAAEDSLSALMARDPDDRWAWVTLVSLYLEDGRHDDALAAAERALDRNPGDEGLPPLLLRAARAAGEDPGALAAAERFEKRHPSAPLAWWFAAVERFDQSVAGIAEGSVEGFARAEREFQRCRELAPQHTQACLGYEVMCRNGIGWSHYNLGELELAKQAFLSMEELFEGGLTWRIEGRLSDGVLGIAFVADRYAQLDDLLGAAEAFLTIHRYDPTNVDWANNTGFFHRDAGDRLENEGEILTLAAAGEVSDATRLERLRKLAGVGAAQIGTPAEREAFRREGAARKQRARTLFETSYEAYKIAASLAPDDVRVVNDCALIAIYHLKRDWERSERELLRLVGLGAKQLEDESLDEEARRALTEAWGDVHQNLGVICLEHKKDKRKAKEWFLASLRIGPVARPEVERHYLPQCETE